MRLRSGSKLILVSVLAYGAPLYAQGAAPPEAAATPAPAPSPEPVATPPSPGAPVSETAPAPSATAAVEADVVAAVDDPSDKKKKKKKKKDEGQLRPAGEFSVKGRVYVLAELRRHEREVYDQNTLQAETEHPHTLDFSIPTARVSLKYQSPLPWLSAEVELEAADGPDMKDAYLLAKDRHFSAKVGQFKMPVSAYAMASLFDLPVARRGLLHEILNDWLDVGGRHPGILLGARGRGGIKPSVSLGAFQGRVLQEEIAPGDRNTDPIALRQISPESYLDGQSYVLRAGVELADALDLGAYYEHRVGSAVVNEFDHYLTAGVDAVLDVVFGGAGLRLWADGIVGESWYEHGEKAADDDDALFVAGRLCAGLRFGGMEPDQTYVEPFGLLSVLEPDTEVVSDFVYEAALGVNVGYWDRARLGLQGEIAKSQRNFPSGGTGYFGGRKPDHLSLLLQAAVSF
jgi:hypothetical protein